MIMGAPFRTLPKKILREKNEISIFSHVEAKYGFSDLQIVSRWVPKENEILTKAPHEG